jgi:iron complex transport system ATP-binding protein
MMTDKSPTDKAPTGQALTDQAIRNKHNSAPLVQVNGLSWVVDGQRLLDDISFSINEGEFVGIIGPNGAGKSSLMRCLYRVNRPSEGSVYCAGDDVWKLSAKESARRTAVILQETSEQMGLSVEQVVSQGLTPHKKLFELDTEADRTLINKLITELELESLRTHSFATLSGGEKQRVMLARAMLQRPRLLIMDEPTNHLDVHFQIEVLRKVKKLPITVLASFHDLNLAAAFCDRLIVMDKGKLVAHGSPSEVISETLISEVFRTCCVVDKHPLYDHPRVSYAVHE